MTNSWATHEDIASGDVFEALHSGLTVELISTHRDDLTAKMHEVARF
jgi:hypothetical protein